MTGSGLYIARFSAWAPGIESPGEWEEWRQGRREIASGAGSPSVAQAVPAIAFTDPMFRRRLSQISRMAVQAAHDLLPVGEGAKMLFASFRGELSRQYQINKMLIEEKALTPAAFSLSVFNAPAALASIALGLKGGYAALYPGNCSIAACLAAAEAALLSGPAGELLFIYADEEAPPEYRRFFEERPLPLAFGLLLSREPRPLSIPLPPLKGGEDSPSAFLRRLLACGEIHVFP
jgi:hypothetical protein